MNLAELYAQQQRDIETFKTVRDKTWTDLKAEHELLIEAFGSREQMPEEYQKRIDQQTREFTKEWSMAGGDRHNALIEQHKKQREAMTGKKEAEKQQAQAKPSKDAISEKQEQLQKIIAQQQAIRKKQEERKHKRGR